MNAFRRCAFLDPGAFLIGLLPFYNLHTMNQTGLTRPAREIPE